MRTQLTGYLGMEFLCGYSRTAQFESYIFTSSQALVLYSYIVLYTAAYFGKHQDILDSRKINQHPLDCVGRCNHKGSLAMVQSSAPKMGREVRPCDTPVCENSPQNTTEQILRNN